MNAVEIEEAISALAEQTFDAAEFPFAFLAAFGNKDTTLRRLRAGATNKSDLGGVLQTNHIHILTCAPGLVSPTLAALKASPATARAKAKFVLATDGIDFEAEELTGRESTEAGPRRSESNAKPRGCLSHCAYESGDKRWAASPLHDRQRVTDESRPLRHVGLSDHRGCGPAIDLRSALF